MKRPRRNHDRRNMHRRPVNVLASVLTTLNLYCGIASIFASISGKYDQAAYFILGAIVFDILDGTVAKMTKSVSAFGKELDSLCDLVSFGVAPAVLIYTAYLHEEALTVSIIRKTGSVIAIIFAICGALRLARYNVFQSEVREYFTGLPIPAAGATVATLVLFTEGLGITVKFYILGPLTLALAILMVSTVRYPKDKLKFFMLAPHNAFRWLVLFVVGIATFQYAIEHSSPKIMLFPLAAMYVLFGIGEEIILQIKRVRARAHAKTAQPNHDASVSKKGDLL